MYLVHFMVHCYCISHTQCCLLSSKHADSPNFDHSQCSCSSGDDTCYHCRWWISSLSQDLPCREVQHISHTSQQSVPCSNLNKLLQPHSHSVWYHPMTCHIYNIFRNQFNKKKILFHSHRKHSAWYLCSLTVRNLSRIGSWHWSHFSALS